MKKETLQKMLISLIRQNGLHGVLEELVIIADDQANAWPKDDPVGDDWYNASEILHASNKQIRIRGAYR